MGAHGFIANETHTGTTFTTASLLSQLALYHRETLRKTGWRVSILHNHVLNFFDIGVIIELKSLPGGRSVSDKPLVHVGVCIYPS